MVKILSWNIAHRDACWESIFNNEYDIALLQEAHQPKIDIPSNVDMYPGEWCTEGDGKRNWRASIIKLSNRIDVEWVECKPIYLATGEELPVSRLGTLAVARITPKNGGVTTIVVSCYSAWERPTKFVDRYWIYSDASAHRLISDICGLMGSEKKHRILVSGDFNILKSYGESGNKYWGKRYASVFERFETIGIPFVGPSYPNGRQASPWPKELPESSDCVPTFYHTKQNPITATRQLDFVFASETLDVSVKALNGIEEWGPSDHCRLDITINN